MLWFIPFALKAVTAISVASGIKSGIEAMDDLDMAKYKSEQASRLSENAKKNMDAANELAMDRLEKLSFTKISILAGNMSDFIAGFERIKNFDVKETEGIDELKDFHELKQELVEIKEAALGVKDIALGGAASVALGSLAPKLVQSTMLHLVTRGGLSGAAASNHALALLGGGAKKIGGMGMAGGASVLKGLGIGSAVSLAGSIFASKARKKYNDAEAEYLQAEALNEHAENTCIVLGGITVRASQLNGVLQILNNYFTDSIKNMYDILDKSGDNFADYSVADKKSVCLCATLAKTIKSIIDTTLLNSDGELEQKSLESLTIGQAYIAQLEAM